MNPTPLPTLPADRPLVVWSNYKLSDDLTELLRAKVAPHTLVFGGRTNRSNLVAGEADAACQSADIAFGQPAVQDLLASPTIRWAHLTSAGYTRYDREDVRTAFAARGVALTNSSGVYANPCAQHVLAMMLSHTRRIADGSRHQIAAREWAHREMRSHAVVLDGQSAVIVGFGSIARRLVELLSPYRMSLAAVRRKPEGTEPIRTHPTASLDELIATADHVINLLPSAPGNHHLFDAGRFARMKPSAGFYNIGRGDTVDQPALIEALTSGRLAAAYLDVTTPEPLPPDHPLWTAANCVITPHIAGGVQDEHRKLVAHFLDNFARLSSGRPLIDRVM